MLHTRPAAIRRIDQRGDDGPGLSTGVMTGKERVLPVQCKWSDSPLDGTVVELDAPIGQEQLEPGPILGDVAQCFPEGRFRGDARAMKVEPFFGRPVLIAAGERHGGHPGRGLG